MQQESMDSTNIYFIPVTEYTAVKKIELSLPSLAPSQVERHGSVSFFDAGTDPVIAYIANSTFLSIPSAYPHISLVFLSPPYRGGNRFREVI